MRNLDRAMKALSLLFSVYSPLYPGDAVLLRTTRGEIPFLAGLIMIPLTVDAVFGEWVAAALIISFLGYAGLHSLWTFLAKRHYRTRSIAVFPIHSTLRSQVKRLTGYDPKGEQLYEIHIDPALVKTVGNSIQAGVRVMHDAQRFTASMKERGTSVSVVGTTYEARLAEVATVAARKNLHGIVRQPDTCPSGSKMLFPNKQWDTFVWEI